MAACSVGSASASSNEFVCSDCAPPRDRRQRLDRDAHDVVLGLLSRQRRPARLRVKAQRERLRIGRAEPLAHHARPQAARGAELRDLLEEVVVRVEEEREPRAEVVRREPRLDGGRAVGDAVRHRERQLLCGRRAGLADVVAGDRDRVPRRDVLRAVREQVGGQPHRRPRREDVVPTRDVLLEDVVLHRPAQRGPRDTLVLGDELVQEQQERRRCVDRHGRRHVGEWDAGEQDLHVGERVDRDAGPADLALGERIVGVVAELRRQIEGDREPGLAVREQVAVPLVRLLRGCEPRVLADRPRPAAVHVTVGAAGVRVLAGKLEPGGASAAV